MLRCAGYLYHAGAGREILSASSFAALDYCKDATIEAVAYTLSLAAAANPPFSPDSFPFRMMQQLLQTSTCRNIAYYPAALCPR